MQVAAVKAGSLFLGRSSPGSRTRDKRLVWNPRSPAPRTCERPNGPGKKSAVALEVAAVAAAVARRDGVVG